MKTLDNFPFPSKQRRDFDRLFNGAVWLLERGRDYQCTDASLATQLRAAAKRRGLRVTISVTDDGLVVQASRDR